MVHSIAQDKKQNFKMFEVIITSLVFMILTLMLMLTYVKSDKNDLEDIKKKEAFIIVVDNTYDESTE